MVTEICESWDDYLEHFPDSKKDIYFEERYVKLYETEDAKALCAVCSSGDKTLLMPFIRKAIADMYDFETSYGYGGPISNTDDEEWNDLALFEMNDLFKREHYICGFVRFHPLLNNAAICKNYMTIVYDRNTVAIDTKESEEKIWTDQITSKNRNMIRKAEKNGLVYKAEYDFESISGFVDLYNATMKRLKADSFFFFDDLYYQSFINKFKGNAFLGTVRKDGELICAAIFMYSRSYGHYHLEGSDINHSNLAANNYLLWKTALEFHKMCIDEFHLGGGYNSNPDNSLLKFKKSFSKNMKDFHIGKWIFDREKYDGLKKEWMINNPDKTVEFGNRLLCYRY